MYTVSYACTQMGNEQALVKKQSDSWEFVIRCTKSYTFLENPRNSRGIVGNIHISGGSKLKV